MLLNILQDTGQSPTTKHFPTQNVGCVKLEKTWPGVSERYKIGDIRDLKEVGAQLSYKLKTMKCQQIWCGQRLEKGLCIGVHFSGVCTIAVKRTGCNQEEDERQVERSNLREPTDVQ